MFNHQYLCTNFWSFHFKWEFCLEFLVTSSFCHSTLCDENWVPWPSFLTSYRARYFGTHGSSLVPSSVHFTLERRSTLLAVLLKLWFGMASYGSFQCKNMPSKLSCFMILWACEQRCTSEQRPREVLWWDAMVCSMLIAQIMLPPLSRFFVVHGIMILGGLIIRFPWRLEVCEQCFKWMQKGLPLTQKRRGLGGVSHPFVENLPDCWSSCPARRAGTCFGSMYCWKKGHLVGVDGPRRA
jgi:hypothetical protein